MSVSETIRLEDAIISTLNYFNLFKRPLNTEEIYSFLTKQTDVKRLQLVLNEMVSCGLIFEHSGHYMLVDNKEFVTERERGKKRADILLDKAIDSVNLISKFPFVSAVCISGSLSKGYANAQSDIDLFIITDKKRLWICRTLLHLYKKLTFFWGKEHSYCMNYFIDESKLCIEEQNIFTATELATLLPVYNVEKHRELIYANKCWLVKTLPNISWNSDMIVASVEKSTARRIVEPFINILAPSLLNLSLMHLTDKLWRLKWRRKKYPMKDYDLAMKTRWYVSKNHPHNYQKRVLNQLDSNKQKQKVAAML